MMKKRLKECFLILKKPFVLDASVLIYDYECLDEFGSNTVIIPMIVIEEINHLKDEKSERGMAATEFSKRLEALSLMGSLSEGVQYRQTLIRICHNQQNDEVTNRLIYDDNDYRIIACAKNNDGILITRDRMLRVLARDFVEAEDYKADRVETKELYKGYREVLTDERTITNLYRCRLENEFGLYPNEFIILRNRENPQHTGVGIEKRGRILTLDPNRFLRDSNLRLRTEALNLEMKMYLQLLLDPDILAVSVMGASGRGKTLQAVDYGLASVHAGNHLQLVYTKSIKPTDDDEKLGFIPGDQNEKMVPHIRPLYDAVEHLHRHEKNAMKISDRMQRMVTETEEIAICPLAYLRGSSIRERVVFHDEAQNTKNRMMKTFITRGEDSSKMIIGGDIDQIDDPFLTRYNNGLTNIIERGKDEDFIGHITMDIAEEAKRGKLATFGSLKM